MLYLQCQAQQFQWVKDNYPLIYEKLKYYVKKGRFIPVGGTWVEMVRFYATSWQCII